MRRTSGADIMVKKEAKNKTMKMFRKKLSDFRGERTQKEMAELYGTRQQNWFHWESGVSRPRDYSLMKRIAEDAGSTVEELFYIE